jgi:transposase InsO family protein
MKTYLSENRECDLQPAPGASPGFEGAVLDTGAQKSVIGIHQARAYYRAYGSLLHSHDPKSSAALFKFGAKTHRSVGKIQIVIPTPKQPIIHDVDVIDLEIPLLLGLDFFDEYSLNPLSVQNNLWSMEGHWVLPITRKYGHLYLCWNPHPSLSTHYTRAQLHHLHRHFFHPSAGKLLNLLQRAHPEHLTPDTRQILQDISSSCETCVRYSSAPITFQVRMPDEVFFNKEIRMDLMYLEEAGKQRPVLTIVDAGTTFTSAVFLSAASSKAVWDAFLQCWTTIYTGFPDSILTDQGSLFTSADWHAACNMARIHLRHTGTESHNSLGAGERFHSPLRRIFKKVTIEYPSVTAELRLSLSIKAMNDCVGPEGLVPSLLVFGVMPRLPDLPRQIPSQIERFKCLYKARREYEHWVCRQRIMIGLKRRPPPASSYCIMPGDKVAVYREGLREFTGPYIATGVHGKEILVELGQSTGPRSFNIAQVKPWPLQNEGAPALDRPQFPLVRDKTPLPGLSEIHWTEVVYPNDPRTKLFDFEKQKELYGLIERGTFRLVLREESGARPNIIPSRFVLSIKHESGHEKLKARFVLGGHRDREKKSQVHSTTNLKQQSIRILLALASIFGFDLWSSDVNQAYLQSAAELQRDIFIQPEELALGPNELIKLVLPLYGITEGGDYWGETLTNHHINDLEMKQTKGDFSLFFKHIADRLVGLSGSFVDDLVRAGTLNFKANSNKATENRFDVKPPTENDFVFTGIEVRSEQGSRSLSQTTYIERLNFVPADCTFENICTIRAKLAWAAHTRPDISFSVSRLAQTIASTFDKTVVALANKVIKHLKSHPELALRYPELDKRTLRLLAYSDASLHNNSDTSSQLGYVILLADATGLCCVLSFRSFKSKRIARSSMAAETMAFADTFDASFAIKHDLESMLGQRIPLLILTDSRPLFDVLVCAKYTTEKRLMIDISAAREGFNRRDITNVCLIRSEHNVADAMTKFSSNNALNRLLETHMVQHPVEQYVVDPLPHKGHHAVPIRPLEAKTSGKPDPVHTPRKDPSQTPS